MPTFSYTSGNPSNLAAGGAANMTDIQGSFTDLRSAINGNFDETNVPNLTAAFTTYKQLHRAISTISVLAANTYLLSLANLAASVPVGSTSGSVGMMLIELDPTMFNANARTTKLRIRFTVVTNGVAPAITFTVGLYPVATYGSLTSAAEPWIGTVGTVVSGSTAAIASPALTTRVTASSGDFNFPSAGAYVLGVTTSGAMAANSMISAVAFLEMRQV